MVYTRPFFDQESSSFSAIGELRNDRPRGGHDFSKFPMLITQRPNLPSFTFLSLSLYLPFRLIYRLEQISERDTTIEINPCELGDRFIRVLTIAIPVIAIYIYIYIQNWYKILCATIYSF